MVEVEDLLSKASSGEKTDGVARKPLASSAEIGSEHLVTWRVL